MIDEKMEEVLINALLHSKIGEFNIRHFSYNKLKMPLTQDSKYFQEVIAWIDGLESIPYYMKEVLEKDAAHPCQKEVNAAMEKFRREYTPVSASAPEVTKSSPVINDPVKEKEEAAKAAAAEAKRLMDEAKAAKRKMRLEKREAKELRKQQYLDREQRKLQLVEEFLRSGESSLMSFHKNLPLEDRELIQYQSLLLVYNHNKDAIMAKLKDEADAEEARIQQEKEAQEKAKDAEIERLKKEADEREEAIKVEFRKGQEIVAAVNAEATVKALKEMGLFDKVDDVVAYSHETRDKICNDVQPAIARLEKQVQVLKACVFALLDQSGFKRPTKIETGDYIKYRDQPNL